MCQRSVRKRNALQTVPCSHMSVQTLGSPHPRDPHGASRPRGVTGSAKSARDVAVTALKSTMSERQSVLSHGDQLPHEKQCNDEASFCLEHSLKAAGKQGRVLEGRSIWQVLRESGSRLSWLGSGLRDNLKVRPPQQPTSST